MTTATSLSGLTSQPNLNSIVNALRSDSRDTGLDLNFLNELSIYWEAVVNSTDPSYQPEVRQRRSLHPRNARWPIHQPPRAGPCTRSRLSLASRPLLPRSQPSPQRHHVSAPSSKVVGDLAMFLLTKGVEPADLVNLEPGTAFPESVVDMLSGGLGQPVGGRPSRAEDRPRRSQTLSRTPRAPKRSWPTHELAEKLSRIKDDDLYAYLMYPQVFTDLDKYVKQYGHARVLPTPAFFFHGLQPGEEITVESSRARPSSSNSSMSPSRMKTDNAPSPLS